jgi:phosphoglycerate dehydrogenase-like enzyme
MARPRLLVLAGEALFRSFFDAPRQRRLSRRFDWRRLPERALTPRLRAALADVEALVTTWDSPRLGPDLERLAPRLRAIAHCGGEVKGRFARPLFARFVITNAPGPMAPYVAELAVALALHAVRRIDAYREALRRPSNRVYSDLHLHGGGEETLRDRTVGIVGLGRIGRAVAERLRPFGPRLLVHDPFVPAAAVRRQGARRVRLEPLLRASHVLILAAALTDATRDLLDARRLALLPDGATVVNVARGGLVDLEALTREVRRGRLTCALDVTDPAEPLPLRHPLRRLRGAVVTPHVGAAAGAVRRAMADLVLDDLERVFRGARPRNRVTPGMLDLMT